MTMEQFNESVNRDIARMMEQRSDEWVQARIGLVGCSRLSDVLARGKDGKPSSTRKNYMAELLCERLTGVHQESYTSPSMIRGVEMEPEARAEYEMRTGCEVTLHGGMMHPSINGWRGSPDGLVGDDGMIEIKNPNTATHLDTLLNDTIDRAYILQMAGYLEIFNRQWIDFVSYDNRLPDELSMYVRRFFRSELPLDKCREGVIVFLEELNAMEKTLRERMA